MLYLLLRKSQMRFDWDKPAGKKKTPAEPHHKAYDRITANGKLAHIEAKGPQHPDREQLEHGMKIMYRAPEMPRRRKGTITGSDKTGWHVTGQRQGLVLKPSTHVLPREQIWTIPEHEADRAPKGTHIATSEHGRMLRPEIVNERAKKGYARLGMAEWDVLSNPEVVKTMRNQLNNLVKTNRDIMDYFTIQDGILHSESLESMEIYSEFEDKAINSLRRQTANAPDEMLDEFRDHLQGKRDNSRIYWTMMKDGRNAALRKIEDRTEEFRTQDEYNTGAEGDFEAGMRDISAQSATSHFEDSDLKRHIDRDNAIETALSSMHPKFAELLRRHFGLGDYQEPQSVAAIAREMGTTKEKIERAMTLSLQAFAATKGSAALRDFLKSLREEIDLRKSLLYEEELVKSHIKQYARMDGTVVQEHQDRRIAKHPDLVAHENTHGEKIHTGADLKHGPELLEHLKGRGWKQKEVSAVRKKEGAKAGKTENMPEPSTIKGKNQENQALQSAQRTIHKMHEAVKNGSDPVASLQTINTSRGNPYLTAVDNEKKKLLEHFGHEAIDDEKQQKFDKDGHTVILSSDGKKVAFAGGDIDAKGNAPIGSLTGKKEVESTDAGKKDPKFITGRANVSYTAKGNKVESHYALVEAQDVTTSHTIQGHVNRAYPKEIQPRERERVSSQMQMANIMNDIRPEQLGHSANAADGAPIVGKDGAVESGNGRTIALSEAYKRGLADKYKSWLKDEAEHFGLEPEDVEKLKNPMLVRVRDDADGNKDRAEFAREANQSSNLGSSPAEQAWTDADRISNNLLKKFTVDEDGEIYNDDNTDFINGFLDKLGKNEAASLRDADGEPNKKCIERIQNAMFTKVYGSSVLTEFQAESAKPRIRNVLKALNACVGDFAQVKGHDDLDVVPDMMEAIEYTLSHQSARRAEMEHTLKNAGSLNFTGDTPAFKTDFAVNMILAITDRTGSRNRLQNVFKSISNEIKTEVASRENPEVDMFSGPAVPKTKEQVVKTALDKVDRQEIQKSVRSGAFLLRKAHSAAPGGSHGDIGRGKVQSQAGSTDAGAGIGRQAGRERRTEGSLRKAKEEVGVRQAKPGAPGTEGERRQEGREGRRAGAWLIKSHIRSTSFMTERGTRVNRREYNDRRSKKQDTGQLAFDFGFRPDTTDEQKTAAISLGRDTAGLLLRRSGANVLGNAIAEEVTKKGTATFIGREVKSPNDLAAIAQVFRNPKFETLRYFFTKGDKIVGQTGVSSRLPAVACAFPTEAGRGIDNGAAWLKQQMDACGADGFYMMHNHPSGNVDASVQDAGLTEALAAKLPGFKGHLIINHNKYNWINPEMKATIHHEALTGDDDPHQKQGKPHAFLGLAVSQPEHLVKIAQELKRKDGYLLIITQRAGGRGIGGLIEVPVGTSPRKMAAIVRRFTVQTSGAHTFIWAPKGTNPASAKDAIEQGYATDVVIGDQSVGSYFVRDPNKYFGKEISGQTVTPRNDEIQKAHVTAYNRLTHSGTLTRVLAHEDSRVSGYGAKLSAVKGHRDLYKLRTERFGHLPHWGKIDDVTRQHILDAEESIHDRLKAEDFHEKLKTAIGEPPLLDTIDRSGWGQARLFKSHLGLWLIRKSQTSFNFGPYANGKNQMSFDFSAPKHEEVHTVQASTRHLASGAAVQVKEHRRKVQVAEKPQPVAPSLKHSDGNYLYKDVGHVPGSRKELAAEQASMIKQRAKAGEGVDHREVNWDALEENPREAYDLITKDAIAKEVDWDALKEKGMEPGAAFLLYKLFAAVAPKPDDSPQARKDFVFGINNLQERFEDCKTPSDVVAKMREISEEMTGFTMNPEQQKEWERLEEAYRDPAQTFRKLKKEHEALWEAYYGPSGRLQSLKYEQEKRLSRKWKADPELQQRIDALQVDVDAARKRDLNWRSEHQAEMDAGEKAASEAWKAQRAFKGGVITTNILSHPLTRGWNSFGKKFHNAINFNSYKGSDAFGTHVATARSGKIKDWDWLEKDSKPRAASKTSVQFQLKVAEHIERVGGSPLPKSDYGTDDIKQEFNLANVQSGNWVLKDLNAAKHHTEQCAMALQDMADMLGIPNEEISMNGRLSLAFGARGSGGTFGPGAAAHYENKYRVINLTKMKGGGSLAHEWLHALDDIAGEVETGERKGRETYATDSPPTTPVLKAFKDLAYEMENGGHNESVKMKVAITEAEKNHWLKRVEQSRKVNFYGSPTIKMIAQAKDLTEAVQAVHDQMSTGRFGAVGGAKAKKQYDLYRQMAVAVHAGIEGTYNAVGFKPGSKFYVESQKIDAGSSAKSTYWQSRKEMAARAFAAYISDKLHSHGRENTYLSSYADNKYYVIDGIKPYPEGEERTRINGAFDRLFDTIKANGTLKKALEIQEAQPLRKALAGAYIIRRKVSTN